MAILWCGGEDIDFPNGSTPAISGSGMRSGYARCMIAPNGTSDVIKSVVFPGGEITSGWVSVQMALRVNDANRRHFGLAKSGTEKGIFIGAAAASATKLCLWHYDGATKTSLATESGTSLTTDLAKYDIQLVSYGASATVRVYRAGLLLIEYSGDISISGVTGFDSIYVANDGANYIPYISEVIVANEDTRNLSLVTLYPDAAGGANEWTGAYTDIDEATINDSDLVYVDEASKNCQVSLSASPAGSFGVKGVMISARATKTDDASIGSLALGIKSGSTISVDGSPDALTTAWATYQHWMASNGATGSSFTAAELDSLQINLQSAA